MTRLKLFCEVFVGTGTLESPETGTLVRTWNLLDDFRRYVVRSLVSNAKIPVQTAIMLVFLNVGNAIFELPDVNSMEDVIHSYLVFYDRARE